MKDDITIDDLKDLLKSMVDNLDSLRDSIVKNVVDAKTENRDSLRELVGYLNNVAMEIKNLSNLMSQISLVSQIVNSAIIKLDNMENKVLEIPSYINDIGEKIGVKIADSEKRSTANLKTVYSIIKKIDTDLAENSNRITKIQTEMVEVIRSLNAINTSSLKSQDTTNALLNKLIEGNLDMVKKSNNATIDDRSKDKEAKREITKGKLNFQTKLILGLVSSGGLIYLIVKTVLGLISGKPPTP